VNDCQIDPCDHYSILLNSEAVSLEVSSYVVDVAVVLMAATEAGNAEKAVGTGQDYPHLNLH